MRLSSEAVQVRRIIMSEVDLECDPCRDWVVEKGLYNYPTTCKHPERLSDKMWDVIHSMEFACKVRLGFYPEPIHVCHYDNGEVILSIEILP